MAIFGVKKKKDDSAKASPPQRELPNGRFEGQNQPPPAQFPGMPVNGPGVNGGSLGDRDRRAMQPPLGPGPVRGNMGPAGMGAGFPQGVNGMAMRPAPEMAAQAPPPPQQRPPTQMAPPAAAAGPGVKPPSTTIYPWSHRRLGLIPPIPFPSDSDVRGSAMTRPSPAPFPRYGHSVNSMAGTTSAGEGTVGDLYIFGGLVGDSIRNDLHVLQIAPLAPGLPPHAAHNQILSVGLVETRGEVPRPRIGHASVGVGNVLIIWGGDTKSANEPTQDPGLYLLNLTTREWTRVKVAGTTPEGRYGHAAAIIGSRFFVFGGQTDDGGFMNDLWSFDLQKLKTGAPKWTPLEVAPSGPVPSRRTGHTIVTYGDCVYLFGGTDGNYHYNDVWRFDTNTGAWTELDCIGFIPMPREGHAATLVDDVMYILGGRGIDAKDLDDLAAFKITNQRWYMFQNMGPAPAGRSGHSMVSWQNKVYVLGGESYTADRPDDPSIVHVLDTNKIKYPTDSSRKNEPARNTMRQSAAPAAIAAATQADAQRTATPPNIAGPLQRSASSEQQATIAPRQENVRATSPTNARAATPSMASAPAQAADTKPTAVDAGPSRRTVNGMPLAQPSSPPRPRRDDPRALAAAAQPAPARAISPVQATTPNLTSTGMVASPSNRSTDSASSQPRAMSPVQRAISPNQSFQARMQSSPPSKAPNGAQTHVDPARVGPQIARVSTRDARSPTPPASGIERATTPQPVAKRAAPDSPRQTAPTPSGPVAAATPAPVSKPSPETARRMDWLRTTLALAVEQGFVAPAPSEDEQVTDPLVDLEAVKLGEKSSLQRQLVSALLHLKQELAVAQTALNEQAEQLDDRVADAQTGRLAALHEASFYRAKLAAYESGSVSDATKVDRERIEDLEQKLSQAVTARTAAERHATQLVTNLEQEQSARAMLDERASTTALRAETAEAAHTRLVAEHADLQSKSLGFDTALQTHLEKIMTLQSAHAQLQADHDHQGGRLATADEANVQYGQALQQMQATLLAANARADETHSLWTSSKSEVDVHKEEAARVQREVEDCRKEAATATAQIEELARVLKTTRDENEALRTLTAGSMAELVASTRSHQSADIGSSELHQSKSRAIEEEVKSLRSLHQQSVSRLEASGSELAALKARNVELERHLISARSEVDGLRARHASALQDAGRAKAQMAARDLDLRDRARATEAAELRAGLLRSLMAENGLTVDDDFANRSLESVTTNTESPEQLARRLHELESRLEQRTRSHRDLEGAHDETVRDLRATEERLREASRKHEAAADEISSLVQEVQRLRSGGATSVTHSSEAHGQVEEDLAALQERHRALETTHLKAVQYVKGTEKMLRRMKEELSKYKERNEQLETELATRGGGEEGSGDVAMRGQLEALQSQLNNVRSSSEKARAENEDLQQHIVSLQSEYAQRVGQQEEEAAGRIAVHEAEVDRLRDAHSLAQRELEAAAEQNRTLSDRLASRAANDGGDDDEEGHKQLEASLIQAQKQSERLKQENAALETRCKDAEAKISLLLEHIDHTTPASAHDPAFSVDSWTDSRRSSVAPESAESDYSGAATGDNAATVTVDGERTPEL